MKWLTSASFYSIVGFWWTENKCMHINIQINLVDNQSNNLFWMAEPRNSYSPGSDGQIILSQSRLSDVFIPYWSEGHDTATVTVIGINCNQPNQATREAKTDEDI